MDVEDFKKKYEQLKDNPMYKNFCSILDTKSQVLERTAKENQELKQKLNWVAFGDDPELSLRYLRKIGYVDFDEERKVYINKHNNEPFLLKDEQEKDYYIKDEELNEYTTQLEYKVKESKKQLEDLFSENSELRKKLENSMTFQDYEYTLNKKIQLENQQKEFIEYLESEMILFQEYMKEIECSDRCHGDYPITYWSSKCKLNEVAEILSKYKEIIGDKDEN